MAPKRQQSIPWLELCAALTGAQLCSLLHRELTLSITQTFLWTDSMTVLAWLTSESCRFKVFIRTRVSEIQELTSQHTWWYVDTANNPADYLNRSKTLPELAVPNRFFSLLRDSPEKWPSLPTSTEPEEVAELLELCRGRKLKQSTFCGLTQTSMKHKVPDVTQFVRWTDLVRATQKCTNGAAADLSTPQYDFSPRYFR